MSIRSAFLAGVLTVGLVVSSVVVKHKATVPAYPALDLPLSFVADTTLLPLTIVPGVLEALADCAVGR